MYVDIPEFKRCCFCIPLRRGLLAWGYLKLIVTLLVLAFMVAIFEYERRNVFSICFEVALIIGVLLELGFTISFIVASHQKDYKLLKYYYYYNMVVFVITSVCLLFSIGLNIYMAFSACTHCFGNFFYMIFLFTGIVLKLLFLVLQFYMILLIRSEIIKLKSNVQFKFINIKNGECTLGAEEKEKTEKVKYDRFESEDSGVYNKCEV